MKLDRMDGGGGGKRFESVIWKCYKRKITTLAGIFASADAVSFNFIQEFQTEGCAKRIYFLFSHFPDNGSAPPQTDTFFHIQKCGLNEEFEPFCKNG